MKMMMMMTTNHEEMMNEAHEEHEQTVELSGGPETHGPDSHELSLDDGHSDSPELLDSPEHPVTATEPLSLPAALCDDKLLEEINSIPDKMGFKIGDVADMLGIKQYVLRYWETEFDLLKPKKASNNQRMYTRKDVENAFLIRKLLHRDRFSIEGARNALKELKAHVKKEKDYSQVVHRLESIHDRIEDLVLEIRRTRQLFK
jgi:DNA-binding transcriptional MerR regulator